MKDSRFNFDIYIQDIIDLKFLKIQEEAKTDMNQKEIMEIIDKHLPDRLYVTQTLDDNIPSLKLFRVTFPYEGFNPNKKECYSHPPKEITEEGRANLKGFPVFYGSFDIGTALAEMKNKMVTGATFYLSLWEIKFEKPIHAHSLIYNSTTLSSDSILNTISQVQDEMLEKPVRNLPTTHINNFKYLVKKMGDMFTMPSDKHYHITSAYAHHILYELPKKKVNMPILIYPSVENKQNSLNFAIHPKLVESNMMDLLQVFKIELKEKDSDRYKINFGHRGRFGGRKKPVWDQLTLSLENGDFTNLQLKTYNDTFFKGKDAFKLKINNSKKTVKDWLNQEMSSTIFRAINTNQLEGENIHPLEFEGESYTQQLIIEYDHGNKVPTSKGLSSIHIVSFPITWKNYFKEFDSPIEDGSPIV